MRCPACGVPWPEEPVFPGGVRTCAACGLQAEVRVADPPTASVESAPAPALPALRCLRCGTPLELREAGGIVVHACAEQHGVFVAHPALATLQAAANAEVLAHTLDTTRDAPLSRDDSVDILPCPRCQRPMLARIFSEPTRVVVDECAEHGAWFDAGELRALVTRSAS